MKSFIRIFLFSIIALLLVHASCSKKTVILNPDHSFAIEDYVYFHNVGITFDGTYYYTINGGNEEYSMLNIYDKKGNLKKTEEVYLDARSIHYLASEDKMMVKIYGLDMVDIDMYDYSNEIDYRYYMWSDNASVAYSYDETELYELLSGEVIVCETETGLESDNFFLDKYYDEPLYSTAIAAGPKHLFIWGSENKIYMYNRAGELQDSLMIDFDAYPLSLSYCNDKLWIAVDADANNKGGTGYWYGFNIK